MASSGSIKKNTDRVSDLSDLLSLVGLLVVLFFYFFLLFLSLEFVSKKFFQFRPSAGPTRGGTLIEIDGQNLGSDPRAVRVNVGTVPCEVVHFKAPNR